MKNFGLDEMETTAAVVGFDKKTGEYRFGRVFIYANGAESYFDARGFRGSPGFKLKKITNE